VGHPLVTFVSNAGWIAKANRKSYFICGFRVL